MRRTRHPSPLEAEDRGEQQSSQGQTYDVWRLFVALTIRWILYSLGLGMIATLGWVLLHAVAGGSHPFSSPAVNALLQSAVQAGSLFLALKSIVGNGFDEYVVMLKTEPDPD